MRSAHLITPILLFAAPQFVAIAQQLQGTPPPAQEATPQARVATASDVLALASAYYRAAPRVERIRLTAAQGMESSVSEVWLRLDAGDIEHSRTPALRLDFPRLTLVAQADQLVGVHPSNDQDAALLSLPGGLSVASLERAAPPLPFPQVAFAFAPTDQPPRDLPALGPVQWDEAPLAHADGSYTLAASTFAHAGAPAHTIELTITPAGALTAYTMRFETSQSLTTLRAEVFTASDDLGGRDAWRLHTAGRRTLGSLSDLRPRAGEVRAGELVPPLGLLDDRLEGVSLADALRELASLPPQPPAMVAAALILLDPRADQARAARIASEACVSVARELETRRLSSDLDAPRLLVRVVGVMDVEGIAPQRTSELRLAWEVPGPLPAPLLWTGVGRAALARVQGLEASGILLVDDRMRLLGVVPIEGRPLDAAQVAAQVRAILAADAARDDTESGVTNPP